MNKVALHDNEIILNGKVKKLEPLKGRQARLMIPEVISIVSQLVASLDGQVDFSIILGEKEMSIVDVAKLANYFTIIFKDRLQEIEEKIVPFLLQCSPEEEDYIVNRAEPQEIYFALFRAGKFFWRHHVSPDVIEALSFRVAKK